MEARFEDFRAEVLSLSKSKKTMIVDKGIRDELNLNDYGILVLIKEGNLQKNYYPVAKLRLVKLQNNTSYWIAYKFIDKKQLSVGSDYFLFTKNKMLKGRKGLDASKIKLVTTSNKTKDVADYLKEDSDSLSLKKESYKEELESHSPEKKFKNDINIVDVETWEKDRFDNKKYRVPIYESQYIDQLKERHEIVTFEKMVSKFLEKYNTPGFEQERLYAEQMRGAVGELPKGSLVGNAYSRAVEEENRKRKNKEAFAKQVLENGESWSQNYTDEELGDILANVSSLTERKRRKELIAFKYDYQAYISYGLNLLNNENTEDQDNTESLKYDFEIGLEGYLLKKFEQLRKYSFEASVRRAQDSYFGGEFNVISQELSIAGQLNWYPFENPNIVNTTIFYTGILFRYGRARLNTPLTDEVGNYQLYSLPGLRLGLKYNLENGYGFKATYGLENIKVDRIVRSADSGTLPDRAEYYEGKLSLGLSKYF